MSALLVDSRTLVEVRDKLGELHDQLLGMQIVVSGYEGVLGGRALEAGLERFSSRWAEETIKIGGEISDLMGRLMAAAAAYRRIEDGLVADHRARGEPLTGSGTITVSGRGVTTTIFPSRPPHGSGTTTVGGQGSGTTTVGGQGSGTTTVGGQGSGTTTVGGQGSGTTTISGQGVLTTAINTGPSEGSATTSR